jgi:ankyrin repeat protein
LNDTFRLRIILESEEQDEELRQARIHIDFKDHSGNTLLHLAVKQENLELVKLLLDKGVKVDV